MKKSITMLMAIAVLIGITACKKDIPGCTDIAATNYDYEATDNDGSCTYNGSAVFWINSAINYVDVTMNGSTKTITLYYPTGGVDCSSPGCAIYTLPTGSYNYYAEEQGSIIDYWSGTITITKNGCTTLLLN